MSAPSLIKAKGLYTSSNRYGAPEGALVQATNVLILKDGVIQPRWPLTTAQSGGTVYSTSSGTASEWHRVAYLNGYLLGVGKASSSYSFATGLAGSSFTGMSDNITSLAPPGGTSNFTSSTALPFFDCELVTRGQAVYLLAQDAVRRIEYSAGYTGAASVFSPFMSYRAGGGSCAVSCFPRPFKYAAGSLTKATGTTTVVATSPFAHGYVVGLKIKMTSAGETYFPAGEYTVATVPSATTFTYDDATTAGASNRTSGSDQIIAANQLVGSSGFLELNKGVAYRACIVEYDSFGKEYVREVSGRVDVYNTSPFVGTAANKNVQLAVLFTTGSTSNAKVQLYRSAQADVPGDKMSLVYSKYLTSTELSSGIVWITDITPSNGGTALYTNDSLFDNNGVLPGCKTIGAWGDRMVQANIVGLPFITLMLKSVDSSAGGLVAGDALSIYAGGSDINYTAIASTAGFTAYTNFTVFTGGVSSSDVRNTVHSIIDSINWGAASPFSSGLVGIWTAKADYWPGEFVLRDRYPSSQAEYGDAAAMVRTVSAKTTGTSTRDCFSPKLGAKSTVSSVVRGDGAAPGSSTTVVINTSSNHNFAVGEYAVWYSNWNNQTQGSVGGVAIEGAITAVTATSMTLTTASGSEATDSSGGVVALKYRPIIIGERSKNMVRVSRSGTNESFTEFATTRVGSSDAHILKVWGLDDTLLVFKEDGLFKVTASGADKRELSSELLDPTAILWAKDSVASLRGRVYAWLRGGVARIGPGGVEAYISKGKVDDKLEPSTTGTASAALEDLPFSRRAWAVSDDVLGTYELRACMTSSPSAPYTATSNLTYCVETDAWVSDDVYAVGGVIHGGIRYYTMADRHKYQVRSFSYAGDYHEYPSLSAGVVSYNSTTKVATFEYDAAAASDNPVVGATVLSVSDNAIGKVLTTDTGTGFGKVGTAYFANEVLVSSTLTFYNATTSTVQWAPITFATPNQLKMVKELGLMFGVQSLVQYDVACSTELMTTEETNTKYTSFSGVISTAPGINAFVPVVDRITVPQQHKVAQQLNVTLSIPTAVETWTILGLGADGRLIGTKVGR